MRKDTILFLGGVDGFDEQCFPYVISALDKKDPGNKYDFCFMPHAWDKTKKIPESMKIFSSHDWVKFKENRVRTIIASGKGSMDMLVDLLEQLSERNPIKSVYFTDRIENRDDLRSLVVKGVHVINPFCPATLTPSGAPDDGVTFARKAGAQRNLPAPLMEIPFAYSPELLMREMKSFRTPWTFLGDQTCRATKSPFVLVELNCGYEAQESGVWIPYTANQAHSDGYTLAKCVPLGTALIICETGQNHERDCAAGHPTLDAFCLGFQMHQNDFDDFDVSSRGYIYRLRYASESKDFALQHRIMRYALSRSPNCKAVVINNRDCEAMKEALSYIDPTQVPLCALVSSPIVTPVGGRDGGLALLRDSGIKLISRGYGGAPIHIDSGAYRPDRTSRGFSAPEVEAKIVDLVSRAMGLHSLPMHAAPSAAVVRDPTQHQPGELAPSTAFDSDKDDAVVPKMTPLMAKMVQLSMPAAETERHPEGAAQEATARKRKASN